MRATDLGINFRKLVRDDNGSSFKSTCVNEETVDEMGSPRERELAYKLSTRGSGLSDRTGPNLAWAGWIWPGLGHLGLDRPRRPGWRAACYCTTGLLGLRRWAGRPGARLVGDRAGRKRSWSEEERREKEKERRRRRQKKKRKKRGGRGWWVFRINTQNYRFTLLRQKRGADITIPLHADFSGWRWAIKRSKLAA